MYVELYPETKTTFPAKTRPTRIGLVCGSPEVLETYVEAVVASTGELAFAVNDPSDLPTARAKIDDKKKAEEMPDGILVVPEPGQEAEAVAKVPALVREIFFDVPVILQGETHLAEARTRANPDAEIAAAPYTDVIHPRGLDPVQDAHFGIVATQQVIAWNPARTL